MQPRVMPDLALDDRNAWWLAAVGKLKPGVSRGQAQTAVATVSARLAADDSARHANIAVTLVPMRGGIQPKDARQVAPVGFLAAGATGLILLICCANVGNMPLSRAVRRRHEIAVRLSMGATRSRVVRQLLTESVLLAAAASVVGLVLALWATEALAADLLPTANVSPDWHTIAFAAFAALVTGLLFGIAPALHATRGALASALKDGLASLDRRRSGLQNTLVVAQVALSLVLLATSGMFLDSLYRTTQAPLGFEASSHVLAASFDLGMQGYSPERADAFVATLSRQAAALPGVSSVSATSVVPLGNRRTGAEIALDPADADRSTSFTGRGADGYVNVVRTGFFRTLGIALVAGRDFETTDNLSSPGVAIVSEDFARRAWPAANPLGKRISVRGERGPFMTVIGVARTALTFGLGERLRPIVYRPASQAPDERDVTLLVRSAGDATQLASAIRAAVRALDPDLPLYAMQSLGACRRARLSDMALGSSLLGAIGALAMFLATIGIYAVVAFSVGQRVREIGLRIALGAVGSDVTSMFVRDGARLTALGLGIGLALAGIAGRAVSTQFLGVSVMDAATFVIVAALLGSVALVATWIPARRAAAVDPMIALRAE
jgi:predicted permease